MGNRGEDEEDNEVKEEKSIQGDPSENFEMIETEEQEKEEKEKNQNTAEEEQDKALSDKIVCKDSRGRSPIFNACEKNNLSALKLLVEAGFDPDEEDREGWRPIQVAMINETDMGDGEWQSGDIQLKENNATECVLYLLSTSEDIRKRTQVVNHNHDTTHPIPHCVIYHGGIYMMIGAKISLAMINEIKNSESTQAQGSAKKTSQVPQPLLW